MNYTLKNFCQVKMSFFVKIEASLAPLLGIFSITSNGTHAGSLYLALSQFSFVCTDYTLRRNHVNK